MLSDDYHLQAGSVCIDNGDVDFTGVGIKDIDGDKRVLDGDGDGTARVDMGADEYNPDSQEVTQVQAVKLKK